MGILYRRSIPNAVDDQKGIWTLDSKDGPHVTVRLEFRSALHPSPRGVIHTSSFQMSSRVRRTGRQLNGQLRGKDA